MYGLLDARAGRDRGDPSAEPTALYAVVSEAPLADRLRVVIPGYSTSRQSDPVRYSAPAGEPVVGDVCVVVFDDRRDPWALFPGVPAGGGGGSEPNASATVKGVTKLSVAPAVAANPIAAGTNDPRMTDARTPTAHSHPQSDVTGLVAALAAKQDASTAATDAELAAHEADTTSIHGIADTAALVTTSDARLRFASQMKYAVD